MLDMRDRREAPYSQLLEIIANNREEMEDRIVQLKYIDAELDNLYSFGRSFPKDDIEGENCVYHLVSGKAINA